MKNNLRLFISFLFIGSFTYSQIKFSKPDEGQISYRAYYKKVSQDFNYLLLGSNSPQQGISATINEDQSNIKIAGSFTSDKAVISLEADLAASSGIYFFDDQSGSEKGKITFNYFRRIDTNSPYYPTSTLNRAKLKFQVIELITKYKSDYEKLGGLLCSELNMNLLEETCIENKLTNDEVENKLKEYVRKYILQKKLKKNDKTYNDAIKKETASLYEKLGSRNLEMKSYNLKDEDKLLKNGVLIGEKDSELFKSNEEDESENKNEFKTLWGKVLEDFVQKKEFILKKMEDSINDIELKNVEKDWAATQILFYGISPFYERQTVNRFSYDSSKNFKDMFDAERGNVYGVTFTVNWNQRREIGSRSGSKPFNWFIRGGVALARASNISSFTQSTFNITTPVGNDTTGNPIEFSNTKEAFIGDTNFGFGFSKSIFVESYFTPIEAFGIFGRIGYEKIDFKESLNIDDKELIPLRMGFLINLKNKEKNKPLVTVQVFLDRTNLNLDPSDPDNDLRFGIGVGLPINIQPKKKSD